MSKQNDYWLLRYINKICESELFGFCCIDFSFDFIDQFQSKYARGFIYTWLRFQFLLFSLPSLPSAYNATRKRKGNKSNYEFSQESAKKQESWRFEQKGNDAGNQKESGEGRKKENGGKKKRIRWRFVLCVTVTCEKYNGLIACPITISLVTR